MALKRLAATVLTIARYRLELAALDVEEELLHAGALLAGMLAITALATLSVAAGAALLVVALWPVGPLAAIGGVLALLVAATAIAWWRFRIALARKQPFLAATLAELEKDAGAMGLRP